MFGDEAAAREGCGELRVVRREAHVAVERHDEAESGGGAVDRADDRLRDSRKVGILLLEVLVGRPVPRRGRVCCRTRGARIALYALQHVHVGAGAEAFACARQNDHADAVVVRRELHRCANFLLHLAAPGIELVRAVERDGGDAVGDGIEDVGKLVCHGAPHLMSV